MPLREFVFNRREDAQAEFDTLHQEAIETVVADIGRTHAVLILSVTQGSRLYPGCRFDGFALLNAALESLVSNLHLSRQRAGIDALALLRVAVESACVAVHIVNDSGAYLQYLDGVKKYQTGRAISFAKTQIARVGEFWGGLSEVAVHPNATTFGPRHSEKGNVITVGRLEPNPEQEQLQLLMVSLAALIVFRAAELVLFEREDDEFFPLRLCGTDWCVSEIADGVLETRYLQLSEMTRGRSSSMS